VTFAAWLLSRFGPCPEPAEIWYRLRDLRAAFEAGKEAAEKERTDHAGGEQK
jgi:hypothetical protein